MLPLILNAASSRLDIRCKAVGLFLNSTGMEQGPSWRWSYMLGSLLPKNVFRKNDSLLYASTSSVLS